jgi:hypothetical protein
MTTETVTQPINPLVGDLQTINVAQTKHQGDGTREVPGRIVAPGLAIVPTVHNDGTPQHYTLTHVPSGFRASGIRCGLHIQESINTATSHGIDWTVGKEQVIAAIKAVDGLPWELRGGCPDWCTGDGPKPPSWRVRCDTCWWEWEDEHDEGPLDENGAREAARGHVCERQVEIQAPGADEWVWA